MDDLKKILKKERRRFSRRKREIRKEVKEEYLDLVDRKVKEFLTYLGRWCVGLEKAGTKGTSEEGTGV